MEDLEDRVAELRVVLKENWKIDVPPECNEFIKRCIRLKDFNEDKALKLIQKFHAMMNDVNSWDAKLQPSLYENLYKRSYCNAMPELDSLGRRIFVVKPGKWNPKEFNFDSALLAIWCLGQYSTYEFIEAQHNGIVNIWDFTGFTLQQAWNVKTRRLVDVALWVQDAILARIKEFHIIFHPRVIGVIYSAMKPFLKDKLKSRIHFHHDLSGLHKYVQPQLLPVSLGGNESSTEDTFYDKEFLEGLLEQDRFFQAWIERGFPGK